jgi:predicted RNA-binding Zn-ribbon protein involved in translation (DUF1610 family)
MTTNRNLEYCWLCPHCGEMVRCLTSTLEEQYRRAPLQAACPTCGIRSVAPPAQVPEFKEKR